MMTLACKFNSSTLSQMAYAWYWTNKTLYFSLWKIYEYYLWGPRSSMHNRNILAVKRVEYCRLQQRISKGGFFQTKNHDKGSTSCMLVKYILSFPRKCNAWTWRCHIPLQAQKQLNHQSGSQNTTPSLITLMWNLKIHNDNVIGLTFIHPDT